MSPPLCQERSLWTIAFGLGNQRTGGFFFIAVNAILVSDSGLGIWYRGLKGWRPPVATFR